MSCRRIALSVGLASGVGVALGGSGLQIDGVGVASGVGVALGGSGLRVDGVGIRGEGCGCLGLRIECLVLWSEGLGVRV